MVICDTNIWYGIGDGAINPLSFGNEQLACTHVTLRELASTHNLYKYPNAVRNAFRAIKNYAKVVLVKDALGYATEKFVEDYLADVRFGSELLKELHLLLNFEFNATEENLIKAKEYFHLYSKAFNNGIEEINEIMKPRKEYVRQQKLKKIIRAADLTSGFKVYFANMMLQSNIESEVNTQPLAISLSSKSWDEFELITHVWTDFFKELDISAQTVKPNDWADLLNVIYVGKADKFWTKEKKWLRLIEGNSITAKYLYRPVFD